VREVSDEIERRGVRPVEILEHEQHGRHGCTLRQERKCLLEDADLRSRLPAGEHLEPAERP
jgi:hypothetical protein